MEMIERENHFSIRSGLESWQSADRYWEDLALAADCTDRAAGPSEIAGRLNAAENPLPYVLPLARTIYGVVAAAAEQPAECGPHAARVSELISLLRPAALTSALRSEVDQRARQVFLAEAALVLTTPALVRTTFAACAAFDRPLVAPLRELFKNLARTAMGGAPEAAEAEAVLRDIVGSRLDVSSRTTPEGAPANGRREVNQRVPGRVTPEADRIVQMALEVGAPGEAVWIALDELVAQDRERELLDAVKRAPATTLTDAIIRRLATPNFLLGVLHEDPIDVELLDSVIRAMGIAAAKPLIEVLAESRSRTTRRAILDRLPALGEDVGPLVEARLRDTRWFVVRNMLEVLRESGATHTIRPAVRFLQHKDARVRREALLLLTGTPSTAEEAIVTALQDVDREVLRTALQAARKNLPEAAIPILAKRLIEDVEYPPEFRVITIRLLGRTRSTLALDALLHHVHGGKSLFGKPKLARKSPEMLASLGALRRSHMADRRARAIVEFAAKSRDAQIADAVRNYGDTDES